MSDLKVSVDAQFSWLFQDGQFILPIFLRAFLGLPMKI